jgi:hypothetical protein
MKTVALMTDFGLSDNFVGVMKGVILTINPQVTLVDISHDIKPQDVISAAFLLKTSYRYFPKGTIFLVVVDPTVGSTRKPIIIQCRNYFFVGPDNGVLSLAAIEDGIRRIVLIENKRYFLKPPSDTFHGRDIFAPASAYLSKDKLLHIFGRTLDSIKTLNISAPKISKNILKSEIVYIDRFGNLVSGIDKVSFVRFTQNKKFKIKIKGVELNSVVKSYQAVKSGKPLAIFGSFGFLEISVSRSSAQRYLNAKKGTAISIII